MKRIVTLSLVLLLLAVLLLPFSAAAAGDEPLVIDNADLLTEQEEQALETAAKELSARRNVKVVVLTTQTTGDRDAEAFADDYYDAHFALVDDPDGILLLISIMERDIYISTAGTMIDIVDEDQVDEILDYIIEDASRGNYGACFEKYLKKVDAEIETYPKRLEEKQRREAEELQREKEARKRRLISSFFLAPGIGLLIGLIPISHEKSKLTTVRSNSDAAAYYDNSLRQMTVTRDIFLYTNTATRVIQTASRVDSGGSHSSSSSHTHVSSSGVSHGGHGRKF